ncbi:mixed lineage kinase domain-like protein isoform 1-T2 [Aulostomus maculatus]
MDLVDPILSIASEIYSLVEKVKANKKRCQRVSDRVRALDELVRSVKDRRGAEASADVDRALEELVITLTSARELIKTYTSSNWAKRIVNSSCHGDEFTSVNERLNDAFQVVSGALQVEQSNTLSQVFELAARQEQDMVDGRADEEELKRGLMEYMKDQQREFSQLRIKVEKAVEMMSKPSATNEVIRMIKPDELKYEYPKNPFMTTKTSEVYRGEYRGFMVAIKRYIDPKNSSLREVRSIFNKEVETMRRFESPNILRMFGICVQDEGAVNPQFLIIMEYCEKGSLRNVLDSDCELSWTRKAQMCLDAAQGLYRLHQTEEKSKVHGCINSSKFLVAEGYRVKLGGFELAKTETSLKKQTRAKEEQKISSLCYTCPQMLNNINHVYSKGCEMYSFGIVLWEIATQKRPFDECSDTEIHQKVCTEEFKEPVPDDCPEPLRRLIDDCRTNDCFQRPSAGVMMDKLRSAVAQLKM